MARVLVATQPWGLFWIKTGQRVVQIPLQGEAATINTTVYEAATGPTQVAAFVTNDDGELPGWVEEGDYTLTVNGEVFPVSAVSGTVAARVTAAESNIVVLDGRLDVVEPKVATLESQIIPKQLVDAKGDLLVASANDTIARLPVGANNHLPFADSSTATGLAWRDPLIVPRTLADAKGDLLVGTANDTVGRLAVGANEQTLLANSTTASGLEWHDALGAGRVKTYTQPDIIGTPRRLSLLEVGRDSGNWAQGGGIIVEAWTTYMAGGSYCRSYFGNYGVGNAGSVSLLEQHGGAALALQMGPETVVSGNIRKRELYVDIPSWMAWRVQVYYTPNYEVVSAINGNSQIRLTGSLTTLGGEPVIVTSGQGAAWTPVYTAGALEPTRTGGFRKIAQSEAWDTPLTSRERYTDSAYVSWRAQDISNFTMVGLGSGTVGGDFASIDFAWYSLSGGTAQIYEDGFLRGNFGTWTTDTIFSILYDGVNVRYFKDGVLQRTVARAIGAPLYLHGNLHTGEVRSVCFGPYGAASVEPRVSTLEARVSRGVVWAWPVGPLLLSTGWNKVLFGTTEYNVSGYWSTSTHRYTPTAAGYYRFNTALKISGTISANVRFVVALYKNGVDSLWVYDDQPTATSPICGGGGQFHANGTTDYFEIHIFTDESANTIQIDAAKGRSYFQAEGV